MHRDTGEERGPIILATATDMELSAALAKVAPDEARLPIAPGGAAGTRLNGREVALLLTGVGPVAAAATCSAHLARIPNVAGVVNVGLAGAYAVPGEDAGLGRLLVADAECCPEYGLAGEHISDAGTLGFPQLPGPEGPITDRIRLHPEAAAQAMELCLPEVERCAFASVAGVSTTAQRAAAIARRFDAGAEGMEGFALALCCALHNIPFLEIRTVSNVAGSRSASDWDLEAAFNSLGILTEKIFNGIRKS